MIGMWAVTEMVEAQRTSKFHERGKPYEKSVTMDAKKFMDMISEDVIPAALAKVGAGFISNARSK